MQVTLTTMLLMSVVFMMAFNPVSVRAYGQLSPLEGKVCYRYCYFLLLEEVEYNFDIYGVQIFSDD